MAGTIKHTITTILFHKRYQIASLEENVSSSRYVYLISLCVQFQNFNRTTELRKWLLQQIFDRYILL